MISWLKKKKVLPRWKLLAMLLIGIWSGLMLSNGLSFSNIWIIFFWAYYGFGNLFLHQIGINRILILEDNFKQALN